MHPTAAVASYAALFLGSAVGGEFYSLGEFRTYQWHSFDIHNRVAELRGCPHLSDLERFASRADGAAIVASRIRYWWRVVAYARALQAQRLHHADEALAYEKGAMAYIYALRELEDAYRQYWWFRARRKALAEYRRMCPWHFEEGVLP